MVEYYTVAGLGERPHNLSPRDVLGLISAVPVDELTILTLKPGFYPNHPTTGAPLQYSMEAAMAAANIDVLCTAETGLSGVDVCELYRDVLPPNPADDAKYGTGWKRDLVRYMTSSPVFSYVCRGNNAYKTVRGIKDKARRANMNGDEWSKVVANVGHVPDPEDFVISLGVLFLGGLGVHSLIDSERI